MNVSAPLFFSRLEQAGKQCPTSTIADAAVGNGKCGRTETVGEVPHHLTDEEREAAIVRAGKLVEHYVSKWEETGDFQYRGDADRALRYQTILCQGRSDAVKARMERERGLI